MPKSEPNGKSSKQVVDKVSFGHYLNLTYVCGIRQDGIVAHHSFVGGMNTQRFIEYVRDVLCPTLRRGDIVVMDNLPVHHHECIGCLIRKRGAELLYLPPYSPDLNPIEKSFSKLKSLLRKEKIRDVENLLTFSQQSGHSITPSDCVGYFKHCGYNIPHNLE